MAQFTIDNEMMKNDSIPPFSLTVDDTAVTVIYSRIDMQAKIVDALQNRARLPVFNQQEGLYDRLSVESNVAFYSKWFGCTVPVPEVLVLFQLQNCAKKPLHECTNSEVHRVYFAKYYMSGASPMIFQEPVHGVDDETIDVFMAMVQHLLDSDIPVLVFVSNIEHALLVGDAAYKLHENHLQPIEMDEESGTSGKEEKADLKTTKLFKVSAKVDDKTILFDPPEIDYIESQDGKAMLVVNDEAYAMDTTLTEMEKRLAPYGFYRCHRSYIVNLQKVREIITWSKNTYSLRINNQAQSTIPLSRSKVQSIQEQFDLQ